MKIITYITRSILLPLTGVFFCVVIANCQKIQRYNSFSYNVNEGLLQSNVLDMAFDQNNFCWLGFANGIQKFDGKNFVSIPVQPGLPDDKWVNFFQCSNGDLLISHSQGISKYEISGNRFTQFYYNNTTEKMGVIFMGEDGGIIYLYTESGNIVGIDHHTLKIIKVMSIGLPGFFSEAVFKPRISDNIIHHKVAILLNSVFYLCDLQQWKLLYKSTPIVGVSPFFLTLKSDQEVLYYKFGIKNMDLGLYNFTSKTDSIISESRNETVRSFRSVIYPWQGKTLMSYYNNLYEKDSSFKISNSELVNFQNQPIAGNSTIARIKEDIYGNLYLVTINGGFKKIIANNYPIKYYGTENTAGNYVISVLPDKKNNRVLAGTYGNGLLVFDTLQHLIKHFKILPGENHSFSANAIVKNDIGDYLVFVCGSRSVWKLSSDFSKMEPIKISTSLPENKSGIGYFGNFLFQDKQGAVVQSQSKVYRANFTVNSVTEHAITSASTMSGFFRNGILITHSDDELIFFDAATLKELRRVSFKNTGGVRCFAKDAANNIYLGSNKGIFKIDSEGKILSHLGKEDGLPDECIYAMSFDDNDFLWCSTNKGVYKVNKDNSILQLKKDDGLQENEFNTNVVAKSEDGELFFGGVNGISSFFPAAISSPEEKINLLLTGIKINNKEAFTDTAVWNILKIDLPHNQNSLAFDFIAMANNNPGLYTYQYKMDGIDQQWIQNKDLQTVRYFLPPGNYVFKIAASRFFNKDAKAMKEIQISIHPPFFKTWWFIAGLGILLVSALAYFINQYNRRKYQKKLAELEGEHKIRLERERISRDLHDSIGAYANAVLYNTELLENETGSKLREGLMRDLKFASKDIITSLRETIWAFRKDNYAADDCLLRIRNFIQPFTRYYPHINFKVEGTAPANRTLHYTSALNLVRIVQEAVTNAIKHAEPENIRIISNFNDEQWELMVTDDGKGFDDESLQQAEQGNGLNNMKRRAFDSNFYLTIQSSQGAGTSIITRI
ncbi:MAG: ATP-binding protein [Ferruginibacter sp.]